MSDATAMAITGRSGKVIVEVVKAVTMRLGNKIRVTPLRKIPRHHRDRGYQGAPRDLSPVVICTLYLICGKGVVGF